MALSSNLFLPCGLFFTRPKHNWLVNDCFCNHPAVIYIKVHLLIQIEFNQILIVLSHAIEVSLAFRVLLFILFVLHLVMHGHHHLAFAFITKLGKDKSLY